MRGINLRIRAIWTVTLLITGVMLASSGYCQGNDAGPNIVSDVIVGHNNKGPYYLAWTDFDPGSVTVVVNGRTLRKGDDYRIDPTTGVLAFNSVLVSDAIVRVSYRIVPGKSKKSTKQLNVPVSLNVFQDKTTALRVTGLFAQDDPNRPDSGKTVMGVGGDKVWNAGKVNSMLLLSQRNDANEGSVWDRAALKFGGDTQFGGFKIAGSYLHSGNVFGGAKEYGLALGKNAADLSLTYSAEGPMLFSAKYQSSEDTTGATKGAYSHLNEQLIVYKPLVSTKLSVVHSSTESAGANGAGARAVDSNLVRLDSSLGNATTAFVLTEDAKTNNAGVEDHVRTQQVGVTTDALRKVNLRSLVTQKRSGLYGEDRGFTFGATATPNQQVSVDVNYGSLQNQAVGQQVSTDAKVSVSPVQQVAVQASFSEVDSSKLGETTKTHVAVKAMPVKEVELQGSLIGSQQDRTKQFQRDFSLSSSATRYAKLTATLSQKGINNWDDVTKGALLELNPLSGLRLLAGYKYIENGPSILTIRDYAASSKTCRFLSLTGSFRDRETALGTAPDTASVQVALNPMPALVLTGDYQANPEDKNGVVQTYRSTAMGVGARMGSLALTSNYTAKDEYYAGLLTDERNVSLEMPFFRAGRISTGYKVARAVGLSTLETRTYSLGYKRAIGSDFSLALTGYYTEYFRDKIGMPDKNEINAEASLGYRF